MNRIERLLWEEENVKDIAKPKSRAATCARAVSIALLVGVFALVASRPWPASFPDARVQTSEGKWATTQSTAAPTPATHAKAAPAAARGDATTREQPDR